MLLVPPTAHICVAHKAKNEPMILHYNNFTDIF